ncbi:hypothetical protein [Nostoc sp.]|uniref:hypothetical protein n=1 Tax=Nostoc sp. TaxID=1180 RepID=UPI002FFC2C67
MFATEVKDEKPVGDVLRQAAPRLSAKPGVKRHYRYLFSVEALEALFGATPDNPKSFLAVAIEATELSQITIADLAAQMNSCGGSKSNSHSRKLALVNQPKIILMDEVTSCLDNRTQVIYIFEI